MPSRTFSKRTGKTIIKVIAEGIVCRSTRNTALRMKDTTGVDFIKVTAGENSASIIPEPEHNDANNHAAGIAIKTPIRILKSESAVKSQNSLSPESSNSVITVSIGVGSIKGLPTIIAAACHKASQKRATPSDRTAFFIAFIYPKITSSGSAPPTEEGTCA